MASVSFSFNLDPVTSGATQAAAKPSAVSTDAVSAKYDAAQAGVQTQPAMAAVSSPACDGGGCFIVHGEGPGVTTLSVGEEDGGGSDFIALPVLDGVGFLEAPAPSFVGVADFDITLAIGEDQGASTTTVAEIGAGTAPAAQPAQFSMEPIYGPTEIGAVTPLQTAKADLGPIETTPIVEPRPKPESAMAASAIPSPNAATAQAPVETGPIAEPRAKPEVLTSLSFPLPDIKPASIAANGIGGAPAPSSNFISVGDYDSYIASIGSGAPAGASEVAATPEPAAAPVSEAAAPSKPDSVAVTVNTPPPVTDVAAPTTSIAGADAPAVSATETTAPEQVETTSQPAAPAPVANAAESGDSPRMKPASFTTPGPASLSPVQTMPIDNAFSIQVAPSQTPVPISGEATVAAPQTETGMTFTTVDGPVPVEKPEGASVEAPRLSDEDYRITTLAYGEEDSGGG